MANNQSVPRTHRPGFAEKLRKFFMTRDSEAFEQTLETIQDEDGSETNGQHIHVHVEKPAASAPSAESEKSTQDDSEGVEQKLLSAITALDKRITAIEAKLSAPAQDEAPTAQEKPASTDEAPDEDKPKSSQTTHDSAALREAFQDARARAEILAPGLKLPTFDAKAGARHTTDALCALRRRALSAALQSDHAALVKTVAGPQDLSKLTCDAAQAVFYAASELVKQKNLLTSPPSPTQDAPLTDLNRRHAAFWANH